MTSARPGSDGSGSSTDSCPASAPRAKARSAPARRRRSPSSASPARSFVRFASSCSRRRTCRRALVEGGAAAALELEAAAARLEEERPRLEPGRGPQRRPLAAREGDRGERDRRRVDEVGVVPRVRRPRDEERRRRVAESPAKLDERGGASVRLAREARAEAGTGGEDRAHEGSALGPRRGHGRLEGHGVDSIPLALRRLRQGPGVGSRRRGCRARRRRARGSARGRSRPGAGPGGSPRPRARPPSPRRRGRGRRRGRRRGACAGAAAPGASGREPRGASGRRGIGRCRAAASRRRPWRVRRPARASGRASPGRRRRPRSPRRGGASRGTGRRPADAARRACASRVTASTGVSPSAGRPRAGSVADDARAEQAVVERAARRVEGHRQQAQADERRAQEPDEGPRHRARGSRAAGPSRPRRAGPTSACPGSGPSCP